ncbi:Chloroperoxidase [Xylariaceae sp. FL0594]|nr:Chloroperoxidase [Xylariaceae sp. FL0594]
MRFITLLSAIATAANAFPTVENLAKLAQRNGDASSSSSLTDGNSFTLTEETLDELTGHLTKLKEKRLLFDPLLKPIDVSGKHAFKAPDLAGGDQRGPCPGLNALANHGYIPHNGVVGFLDLIVSANTIFGMGIDLITVLAVLATVYVGNPLSLNPGFSIGGATSKSNNILGNVFGLLGKPRGLEGAHNIIESDSSATRDDLYGPSGNAHTMNMTLFKAMLDSTDRDYLTMDDLGQRAADRFHESIATSPTFYYGPYTGLIARNAGFVFLGRFASNHTREHPLGGHLSKDVLCSFFGVTKDPKTGSLVYNEGHERIPENWYRIAADYGLVNYNLDLVPLLLKHPELLSVGGNQGAVNTFAGVDISDLTGGLLNATTLLEGNNLICFALTVLKTFVPNSLSTVVKLLDAPLRLVNKALLDPILDLGCPAFRDLTKGGDDLWNELLGKYPGARMSGLAL